MNENDVMYYEATEAELESIADKIREKIGSTESLVFPNGFITGIQTIKNRSIANA